MYIAIVVRKASAQVGEGLTCASCVAVISARFNHGYYSYGSHGYYNYGTVAIISMVQSLLQLQKLQVG